MNHTLQKCIPVANTMTGNCDFYVEEMKENVSYRVLVSQPSGLNFQTNIRLSFDGGVTYTNIHTYNNTTTSKTFMSALFQISRHFRVQIINNSGSNQYYTVTLQILENLSLAQAQQAL